MIKILYDLKKIDAVIGESALKKLVLHLWYLTKEMIPLAYVRRRGPHDMLFVYLSNVRNAVLNKIR